MHGQDIMMMKVATLSKCRGHIKTPLSDSRTGSPAAELNPRLFWKLKRVLGIPFSQKYQMVLNVICVPIPQFKGRRSPQTTAFATSSTINIFSIKAWIEESLIFLSFFPPF